jgi:hypothetical protein
MQTGTLKILHVKAHIQRTQNQSRNFNRLHACGHAEGANAQGKSGISETSANYLATPAMPKHDKNKKA